MKWCAAQKSCCSFQINLCLPFYEFNYRQAFYSWIDSDMDLKNLIDVSPFLLFEETADSDQPEFSSFNDHSAFMDYAVDQQRIDDNDDAESCSCNVSDHSSISCVSDDFYINGCDDDDDDLEARCTVGEVDEGEIYWGGHECAEERKNGCVDSDQSKEVLMVMDEMERNRLFWETCLAS